MEYCRLPRIKSLDRALRAGVRITNACRTFSRPRVDAGVNTLAYAVRAGLALRNFNCDIVHVHNYSEMLAVLRRLNPRAKIVLHMHCDWLLQLDRSVIQSRLRHADAICGCSDYVTDGIRARFPERAERCTTIYNGVDSEAFSPSTAERNVGAAHRIVYIGRISPEKGLHVLLDAFEHVLARRPDTHLEIVGPEFVAPVEFIVGLSDDPVVIALSRFYAGDYGAHLRSRAKNGLLRGHVSFAGELPREQLITRLQEAKIFVFPSIASEMLGISALEAMAAGLPVVASRICGLPEVVEDGKTGILTERDDPVGLADAILRLLENPEMARSMGAAGRRRVQEKFSWDAAAQALMEVYAGLGSSSMREHDQLYSKHANRAI